MAVTEDFSFPTLLATTTTKNQDNDEESNKNDNKRSASTNQNSSFTLSSSSPSLWRISSLVYPDDEIPDEQEPNSSNGIFVSMKSHSDTEPDLDSEDRMDSLWEDFNENEIVTVRPLQRVSSLDSRESNKRKMIGSSRYITYYPSRSDDIIFDVYDHRTAGNGGSEDQVLKMVKENISNNNCSSSCSSSSISIRTKLTRHRKKNSMAVLLRAFRKIFVIQNMGKNNKKKK
ncbi:hypothetical protein CsatB_003613 [Cannabis sativa]